MTTEQTVSILIALLAVAVLAISYLWSRRTVRPTGGAEALRRAQEEVPKLERLAHGVKARGAQNNFAPLIERALRGG